MGIQYGIDRTEEARSRDIIIFMLGGNDLANGMSIPTVTRQLEDLANGLLKHEAQHVCHHRYLALTKIRLSMMTIGRR